MKAKGTMKMPVAKMKKIVEGEKLIIEKKMLVKKIMEIATINLTTAAAAMIMN